MRTNPQCLIRDNIVLVKDKLIDFFSELFVILYKVKYFSNIFNMHTFG